MKVADVAADDLEEGRLKYDFNPTGTGVDDYDLLHFIEKSALNEGFYDYYNQTLPLVFEHPNMKTNIVWSQNSTTGAFSPVNKHISRGNNVPMEDATGNELENPPFNSKIPLQSSSSDPHNENVSVPPLPPKKEINRADGGEDWTIIRMEYKNFNFMKRIFFLFFQGLLAGFCFTTFYIQIAANLNLTNVLLYLQPLAQDVRRFYYILTSISVVGSMDYILAVWNLHSTVNPLGENVSKITVNQREDYHKTSLFIGIVVLLLHVLSFLSSIIISFDEVQISLRFNFKNSATWTKQALDDSTYSGNVDQWMTADRVRIATAVFAWIGCCFLLWRDVSQYRKLWIHLRRMRNLGYAWMNYSKLLEGSGPYETLSLKEAQELINRLEIGMQRARNSINLLNREN